MASCPAGPGTRLVSQARRAFAASSPVRVRPLGGSCLSLPMSNLRWAHTVPQWGPLVLPSGRSLTTCLGFLSWPEPPPTSCWYPIQEPHTASPGDLVLLLPEPSPAGAGNGVTGFSWTLLPVPCPVTCCPPQTCPNVMEPGVVPRVVRGSGLWSRCGLSARCVTLGRWLNLSVCTSVTWP